MKYAPMKNADKKKVRDEWKDTGKVVRDKRNKPVHKDKRCLST